MRRLERLPLAALFARLQRRLGPAAAAASGLTLSRHGFLRGPLRPAGTEREACGAGAGDGWAVGLGYRHGGELRKVDLLFRVLQVRRREAGMCNRKSHMDTGMYVPTHVCTYLRMYV